MPVGGVAAIVVPQPQIAAPAPAPTKSKKIVAIPGDVSDDDAEEDDLDLEGAMESPPVRFKRNISFDEF